MKRTAHPLPLDTAQIRLVLELLDTRLRSPQETAARFYQLGQAQAFSEGQQDAIELLFELDDDEIADALFAFADDEAREIVRAQLPHEAHLSFIAA